MPTNARRRIADAWHALDVVDGVAHQRQLRRLLLEIPQKFREGSGRETKRADIAELLS
jgi:hypothetical protein